MTGLPWYKRYPKDFMDGTTRLSLEEEGAYSRCLDLIYNQGGAIADDEHWLASQMRCSVRKWKAIRERLLELEKLLIVGGKLTNMRAEIELAKAAKTARKHAENGARGGKARAENAGEVSKPNGLSQAKLKPGSSHTRATPDIQKESPLPPSSVPAPLRSLRRSEIARSLAAPFAVARPETEPISSSEPIPFDRAAQAQAALARHRAGRKSA